MANTRTRKKGGNAKPKVDAYDKITQTIIDALEQGTVPWHRPWNLRADGPRSLSTGKPYQGINVFALTVTAMMRGYSSRWWGTYKTIGERGGQVRGGEHGTSVVHYSMFEKKDKLTGEVTDRIPVLRTFTVFNADQADDLVTPQEEPLAEFEPLAECERISDGYRERGGPEVKHGGDSAHYSPPLDYIQMPLRGQFETVEHYYGTLFHEEAHSTGHESRLNRKAEMIAPFGTPDYSREELVAEMAAAFVCGEAGIGVNVPHRAGYIEHWLGHLRDDKRILVQAAAAAQKAANLILGADTGGSEDEPANGA